MADLKVKELAKEVHALAINKGWYPVPSPTFPECIAMFHSEISEALQLYRDGYAPEEIRIEPDALCESGKPTGIPIEFADVIIRVFDTCEFYGIDIEDAIIRKHEYNKTRPWRHGGKRI